MVVLGGRTSREDDRNRGRDGGGRGKQTPPRNGRERRTPRTSAPTYDSDNLARATHIHTHIPVDVRVTYMSRLSESFIRVVYPGLFTLVRTSGTAHHEHPHARAHARMHAPTRTHAFTRMRTHACARTHARTHTHTHTHTHTSMHLQKRAVPGSNLPRPFPTEAH